MGSTAPDNKAAPAREGNAVPACEGKAAPACEGKAAPACEGKAAPAREDKAAHAREEKPERNTRPIVLIALHVLLFVYSISGVLSKNASMEPFMSPMFILLYGGTILILAIYALGWQQIIKHLPLTLAFTNKAVTVVWGVIWGVLLYGEQITWPMIVGGLLVIAGVVLFGYADAKDQEAAELPEAADATGGDA